MLKKVIVLSVLFCFAATQVGLGMPKEGLRNARDAEKKPFAGSGAAGTFGAYFAKVNEILTAARDPDKSLPERLDAVKQLEDAKAADALRTLAGVLKDDKDEDDKEVRSAAQQALNRIADSDRVAAEQARASATAAAQTAAGAAYVMAEEFFGPAGQIVHGSVEEFMMLDAEAAERQMEEFKAAADAILAKPKEQRGVKDNAMAEAIGSSLEIFAEGQARTARGLKPGEKLPEKNENVVYAFLGGKKTAALMRQVAIDYLCVDFDMKTRGETTEAKIKNRMAEQGIDVGKVGQVICVSSYDLTEEERRLLNRTGKEDIRFSNMFLLESFFQDENTLYTTLNRTFSIPILDTPAAKAAAWTAFKAEQLRHEV